MRCHRRPPQRPRASAAVGSCSRLSALTISHQPDPRAVGGDDGLDAAARPLEGDSSSRTRATGAAVRRPAGRASAVTGGATLAAAVCAHVEAALDHIRAAPHRAEAAEGLRELGAAVLVRYVVGPYTPSDLRWRQMPPRRPPRTGRRRGAERPVALEDRIHRHVAQRPRQPLPLGKLGEARAQLRRRCRACGRRWRAAACTARPASLCAPRGRSRSCCSASTIEDFASCRFWMSGIELDWKMSALLHGTRSSTGASDPDGAAAA